MARKSRKHVAAEIKHYPLYVPETVGYVRLSVKDDMDNSKLLCALHNADNEQLIMPDGLVPSGIVCFADESLGRGLYLVDCSSEMTLLPWRNSTVPLLWCPYPEAIRAEWR